MAQPVTYAYVIERAEDGSYLASVPDLPGPAARRRPTRPSKWSGSFPKRSSCT